jgi:hypothetical protein
MTETGATSSTRKVPLAGHPRPAGARLRRKIFKGVCCLVFAQLALNLLIATSTYAQFGSCQPFGGRCRNGSDCCTGLQCDATTQACVQPNGPRCIALNQSCSAIGLPCCGSPNVYCNDRVSPPVCTQSGAGGFPIPPNPIVVPGQCQAFGRHCTNQAQCCNGLYCDQGTQVCLQPNGRRCMVEGEFCEPTGLPCCSSDQFFCDQRDLVRGPNCKRKSGSQPPPGPIGPPGPIVPPPAGGGSCRTEGQNCGTTMNNCCGGLACDVLHGFTCVKPGSTACGHVGDICGLGQNQCCQHEGLFCDVLGSGRCLVRPDAAPPGEPPPVNPAPPGGGQPPAPQPPVAPPPVQPPPSKGPPSYQPVPQPPPGGRPGGGIIGGSRIKYCPDGKTRCPKDFRSYEAQQNCALCKDAPQPPTVIRNPIPPSPVIEAPQKKILCAIDLPTGLPIVVPSIGQVEPSKQPYFIVYPGTEILMTCTKQSATSASTTNPCKYYGPQLVGDGRSPLRERYVCEATRLRQFCDGKYAGAIVQTNDSTPVLEPHMKPFRYGACVSEITEMYRFLQTADPQVLGEGHGVFYEFSCQPHQAEGADCQYSDATSNPYPYLAHRPTEAELKRGKCRSYFSGPCSTTNPGIAMPVWLYPTCRAARGLRGTDTASWAGSDLGQWTGPVTIGTRELHGPFWYYHPGMVPGPVKLCRP